MSFFFEFFVWKETIFNTPFFTQEFSDVISNAVLEDTYNSFSFIVFPSDFLDELLSSFEDCSWRTTNKKTFLSDEVSGVSEGLGIVSFEPMVNAFSLACARNEIVTNTLDFVGFSFNV